MRFEKKDKNRFYHSKTQYTIIPLLHCSMAEAKTPVS